MSAEFTRAQLGEIAGRKGPLNAHVSALAAFALKQVRRAGRVEEAWRVERCAFLAFMEAKDGGQKIYALGALETARYKLDRLIESTPKGSDT